MGEGWRDCIVVYLDLIGTTGKSQQGVASTEMRALHELVIGEKSRLLSLEHIYAWNDSVLLLALVEGPQFYERVIRDAEILKRSIDTEVCKSFAIAVKGQVFPPPLGGEIECPDDRPTVTVMKASSWAMANCFEIEKACKDLESPWCIDIRIAQEIQTKQDFKEKEVSLFPDREQRTIRAFGGYLWEQP